MGVVRKGFRWRGMFAKAINESSLPELGLTGILGKELPVEVQSRMKKQNTFERYVSNIPKNH